VPRFVDIANTFIQVTKRNQFWQWTPECQNAFEELKRKLSNPPVLAFPDLNLPFILTAGISQVGLGAVLSQVQNEKRDLWLMLAGNLTRLRCRTLL